MHFFVHLLVFVSLLFCTVACAPQLRIKNSHSQSPKDTGLFGGTSKIELDLGGVKFDVTTLKDGSATSYQLVDASAKHFHVDLDGKELESGSESGHPSQFTLAGFKKYTFDIKEGVVEAIAKTNKNEFFEGTLSEDFP